MDTTTFSVAATASELATKVRAWLGGETTPDVAPAMYKLETTAATSEKYAVVLAAVYTVGPRRVDDDDKISPAAGCEEPLLRRGRANLLAPPAPAQISPAWSCPRHVRDLLHRHVRALAAGTSTEEMVAMGSSGFAKEALRRVNLDLVGGGILVYGARVGRLGVEVPCDRMSVAVFAEEGAAPTMAYTIHPVVKLQVSVYVAPGGGGGGALISATMSVGEPATTKKEELAKVYAAGIVAADYHMELRGETTLRLKMKGQITYS